MPSEEFAMVFQVLVTLHASLRLYGGLHFSRLVFSFRPSALSFHPFITPSIQPGLSSSRLALQHSQEPTLPRVERAAHGKPSSAIGPAFSHLSATPPHALVARRTSVANITRAPCLGTLGTQSLEECLFHIIRRHCFPALESDDPLACALPQSKCLSILK